MIHRLIRTLHKPDYFKKNFLLLNFSPLLITAPCEMDSATILNFLSCATLFTLCLQYIAEVGDMIKFTPTLNVSTPLPQHSSFWENIISIAYNGTFGSHPIISCCSI